MKTHTKKGKFNAAPSVVRETNYKMIPQYSHAKKPLHSQ